MIEGHCDEIGLMVQYVDDDGFLYMTALGGVAVGLLAGERVAIRGRKGVVNGLFGMRPPHLLKASERDKGPPTDLADLPVDIGARSRDEALEAVELGSPAVVDAGWRPLCGDRVSSRGFDDRIGAFIVAEALRALAGQPLNVALYAVGSVQEELGLVGATTAAYEIHPHAGICCEVGYATDHPNGDKKTAGDVRLGKGPILCFGPTYNPRLHAAIEAEAGRAGIALQRQVRGRGSNTNAWAIRMAREGAASALLSIPLRYMHSAVEVLSLGDVTQAVRLLAATLAGLPAAPDFRPPPP
jgi:endoglucanase